MIWIIGFNVAAILFLILTGNDRNIESRTEREEKILNKNKK